MNILIIGGNGGLGRNLIKNLYPIASNLIISFTNKKNIKLKKKNIFKYTLNFKSEVQIKKLVQKLSKSFSHIDVIIITTGVFYYDKNLMKYKDIINFYKINVFGHVILINEFYRLKKNDKNTYIFSVGSSSAIKNFPNTSLYCSSKHAMDSFIKCLNFKTHKKKIFNTLIHTGSLKTKMGKKIKNQDYNDFIDPNLISNKVKKNLQKGVYEEEIRFLRKNIRFIYDS